MDIWPVDCPRCSRVRMENLSRPPAPDRVLLINFQSDSDGQYRAAIEADGLRVISLASWPEALAKAGLLRPKLIVAKVGEEVDQDWSNDLQSEAEILAGAAPLILVGDRAALDVADGLFRVEEVETLALPTSPHAVLDLVRQRLAGPSPSQSTRNELVGQSPAFREVLEQIEMVAGRDTTVLITGETGSGKECVARELHRLSRRSGRDMVSVNCAGIPAALLEDEFFGHVRGAFTDAHQDRQGRFEQAHRGTIFLDEIGDLPLELQPKLLRVLQEREFHRVGGVDTISADARVIAATNADLWGQVRDGRYREDLFYRINVFPIHVPPLRNRREDIPLFIERFLEKFCNRDRLAKKITPPVVEAELMARSWPGNIRELENAVEMAVIRSRDRQTLEIVDFPAPMAAPGKRPPAQTGDFKDLVSRFELDLIARVMNRTEGNKTRAADELGIKRTTLVEKLKKLERESCEPELVSVE